MSGLLMMVVLGSGALSSTLDATAAPACDVTALEQLAVVGARTGWGKILLGMKRHEVEQVVGELPALRESPAGGDPSTTMVRYRGQELFLWFRGTDEAAMLIGIVVPFDEVLKACDRDKLARTIRVRIRDLVYDSHLRERTEATDPFPVWVRAADTSTGILLKPAEALYLCPRSTIE
jgi:hypothetical protein